MSNKENRNKQEKDKSETKENKTKGNKIEKQIKESNEYFDVEVGEDSTKYGEFISSYFAWISLEQQKENAERLQNITKKS